MNETVKQLQSTNEKLEKELNQNKINVENLQKQVDNSQVEKENNDQQFLR